MLAFVCYDVCIKNALLQFLVKCKCVESVKWEVKQSFYLAHIFCVVYSTSQYEFIKSLYFLSLSSWISSILPSLVKIVFLFCFLLCHFLFSFFSHHFLDSRKFRRWNMRFQYPRIFFNLVCDWFFLCHLCRWWEFYQTSTRHLCDFTFNQFGDWVLHLLSL